MTAIALPEQTSELSSALARQGLRDVLDTSALARALYSTDASLYRVVPQAVARPRTTDELAEVLAAARAVGMPITTRGAGTSCAGNAVGPGLVVDTSRHLNRIVSLDPEARTAVVQPGVVQALLTKAGAAHGLRFGPDPSTHTRCTIGGMIGNNACGPRALGYGRSADNVVALDVITGAGEQLCLDATTTRDSSTTLAALARVVDADLGTVRTEFGRFGRQVSGYSLEHLLPENRFDVARFLAGTEGTLAVITEATVRLVDDPPYKIMIALGYPSMADAGDAASVITEFSPTAAEGLDRRIVDVVARKLGPAAVPPLPRGDAWMFVELVGDDPAEIRTRADRLLAAAGALEGYVVSDPAHAAALWKIREDGAGLAGVSLPTPAYAGWEDAAVPPVKLGAYLRDFDALMSEYGLLGLPYGHFGDGCVHVRIDYPLTSPGGATVYREFIEAAAGLVAGYGGSMSGEHGDGRARSALLPKMYSPAALQLFGQVKAVFDPQNLMNPGVLVDPRPFDADLRAVALVGRADHFAAEVHRCTGVGKCLANTTSGLGVMCPSYQATREEKDSTRGRARVLQEMVNGSLIDGWRSPEVHDALDLCLSCKGCARDCPTGIDMATYKSEVLDRTYRGRLRPRSHYALGWLPRWGRLITRARVLAPLINAATATPGLRTLIRWSAGVDQRRTLPRFAARSARSPAAAHRTRRHARRGLGRLLLRLLHRRWRRGRRRRPRAGGLCAATAGAKRLLRTDLDHHRPARRSAPPAAPGVGGAASDRRSRHRRSSAWSRPVRPCGGATPPSCCRTTRACPWSVDSVVTLAELLTRTPDWSPPDLTGVELVVQPHCHHASILGWRTDAALLARTGATVTTVGGCCGLAGNFGVEQGHYEVSVKVAEHDLLPAVRAHPDAIVLADGFSCRTQLAELADRSAITLAELLASRSG